MRPPEAPISETESSYVSPDKSKQKTKVKKAKKQTLLGGLALLHGFTSTNIGKNRLTVGLA
jgi:hypothetical protein